MVLVSAGPQFSAVKSLLTTPSFKEYLIRVPHYLGIVRGPTVARALSFGKAPHQGGTTTDVTPYLRATRLEHTSPVLGIPDKK